MLGAARVVPGVAAGVAGGEEEGFPVGIDDGLGPLGGTRVVGVTVAGVGSWKELPAGCTGFVGWVVGRESGLFTMPPTPVCVGVT